VLDLLEKKLNAIADRALHGDPGSFSQTVRCLAGAEFARDKEDAVLVR